MRDKERALVVDGYSERWLRKGFPWVYPKEVVRGLRSSGEVVEVRNAGGAVLGRAITDSGWLAARVFRHDGGALDDGWLRATLERARRLREGCIDPDTDGYRLVHSENDGLPGFRVDRWADRIVVTLDSPSVASLVDGVVHWLVETFEPRAVHLCYRPDSRETLDFSRAQPAPGRLWGEASGPTEVRERGIRIRVYPDEGPDVGLYADMRETRAWLSSRWSGRRVLNTFAYTGAFSVAAALGGASEVVTVDLSEKYLDRARDNFTINGLAASPEDFIAEDTFKALDRFRRKGRTFDTIILDPPSFSHGPAGTWSVVRDYPRLVAAAARVLAPEGWLVVACNSGELSPHKFRGEVEDGLRKADRVGQELWRGSQSPDFPAASWFPEGQYLKVSVWRVP